MNCDQARSRLMTREPGEPATAALEHLGRCSACAEFHDRMVAAHEVLGRRRSDHLPDPHFAARVSAAIPRGRELLGWAALRLLPATLGLALALTAWCWLATPSPSALVELSPTDDVLAWALEGNGS